MADEIGRKFFSRLGAAKSQIESIATEEAQLAYYKFPRPPIDTRASIASTRGQLFLFAKLAILKLSIGTPYANDFRFGKGNNAKYGTRDPLAASKRSILTRIINLWK
jgi:hypothetical protein